MTTNNISKERIQKLWEWCGFTNVTYDGAFFKGWQGYLNEELVHIPDLNSVEALGFLFKYAVTKLLEMGDVGFLKWDGQRDSNKYTIFTAGKRFTDTDDPTTALFLAIEKVMNQEAL